MVCVLKNQMRKIELKMYIFTAISKANMPSISIISYQILWNQKIYLKKLKELLVFKVNKGNFL